MWTYTHIAIRRHCTPYLFTKHCGTPPPPRTRRKHVKFYNRQIKMYTALAAQDVNRRWHNRQNTLLLFFFKFIFCGIQFESIFIYTYSQTVRAVLFYFMIILCNSWRVKKEKSTTVNVWNRWCAKDRNIFTFLCGNRGREVPRNVVGEVLVHWQRPAVNVCRECRTCP